MKKTDEMNVLKNYMLEDFDFMLYAKMNIYNIVRFIKSQYDNNLINYLDKRYLDVSYLVIDDKLIDLDSLWLDFKNYIDELN